MTGDTNKLARTISTLNTADFPPSLLSWLMDYASFDHALILGYRGEQTPLLLHKRYLDPAFEETLPEYLTAAYLLDPIYMAHLAHRQEGVLPLRDVSPDQFRKSAYYQAYYNRTGHEDELTCLVYTESGYTIALSMLRRDKRFSAKEIQTLKQEAPVLCALLRRQWNELSDFDGAETDKADNLPCRIQEALRRDQNISLTIRQAEIIAYILRGHSSLSISLNLNISVETVKVHRRNIYNRLRISSQAELFAMIMELIGPLSPARTA